MKAGQNRRGSESKAAGGARKSRVLLKETAKAAKDMESATDADLEALAAELLTDLGLPRSATRLDQARHYHELRRIIRKSAPSGTADRQLAAALGTLSKQAQHVLDGLKKEAADLAARGSEPSPAPGGTGRTSPADVSPASASDVKTDDWGMPVV